MAETITSVVLPLSEAPDHPVSDVDNVTDTLEISEQTKEGVIQRPKRTELSEEEVLQRMKEFPLRKDKFIAAVRKGKNRSIYP